MLVLMVITIFVLSACSEENLVHYSSKKEAFFEKNKEDSNYIKLSNGEYDISLVEGHTISEDVPILKSAIKEVKVVKE